jgi:trehalose 2-sulfotransferase
VSCVICTTPRTGSWLLSEALAATGLAGRPEEYLRPDWYDRFCRKGHLEFQHRLNYWPGYDRVTAGGTATGAIVGSEACAASGRSGYRRFLDAARSIGTANGIFAIKIHRIQLDDAVDRLGQEEPGVDDVALIRSWLPEPRFVHLRREDGVRRAVSHYRAMQSGVWWRYHDHRRTEATVPVDPETIDRLIRRCERHDEAWLDFFARAGVTAFDLTYEQLADDLPGAVAAVLRHVGAAPSGAAELPEPRLLRQGDGWTEEAVRRYVTWRRIHSSLDARHYGFEAVG